MPGHANLRSPIKSTFVARHRDDSSYFGPVPGQCSVSQILRLSGVLVDHSLSTRSRKSLIINQVAPIEKLSTQLPLKILFHLTAT